MSRQRTPGHGGALLRPALELAWAVARLGMENRPVVSPPRALRPFLQFARLPERALATLRRVVDEDESFRGRVAELAVESELGRIPWLWLTRPDGWEEELAEAEKAADELAAEANDSRADRDARRRLHGAEAARRRAEEQAEEAQKALAAAAEELAGERQARADATAEAARLQTSLDRLEERAKLVQAESDRAAGRLHEMRDGRARAAAERQQLSGRVAELEQALHAAQSEVSRLETEARLLAGRRPEEPTPAPVDTPAPTVTPQVASTSPEANVDGFPAAARAVAEAAVAAAALSRSLAAAAAAFGDPGPVGTEKPSPPPGPERSLPTATATAAGADGARRVGRPVGTPRRMVRRPRRPARLPPAVFDDSPEAADFLVRLPGALLLVDGYNVSMVGWSDLEISEQRRHLTSALAELVVRVGVEAHVIFDGAEEPLPPGGVRARQAVRVIFSPPRVEADEVIIELVGQLPPDRPLLVATNDRRVQDEVRRLGANVLSSDQLLGVLGRGARRR